MDKQSKEELLLNCCKACNVYNKDLSNSKYVYLIQKCTTEECPVLDLYYRFIDNEKYIEKLEQKIDNLQQNQVKAMEILRNKS